MLRFAIVAVVLLVLVISYATRLGDREESATETDSADEVTSNAAADSRETPVAPAVGDDRQAEDWFPDLTDRNDLPGIDLGAATTRDTFGCNINELAARLGVDQTFDGAEGEARITGLLETFEASGDAELQLAGGLMADASDSGMDNLDDRFGSMASLERAYRSNPVHPLVLWYAADACGEDATSGFCGDPQLEANIRTVLGNNGEYWALVAEQRYGLGDEAGALEALRRAAVAPEFDNYFMANVRMFQRAFSMIPDTGYAVQTLGAYAVSNVLSESGRINIVCGPDVEARPEWLDACLAVAARYEAESRLISQQRWGAGSQARLLELAGQHEEAEAARTRQRELRDFRSFVDEDIVAVMMTDESVMAMFVEEFEAGDELSAMLFVRDEVERLKQDPTYHPCPSEDVSGATD